MAKTEWEKEGGQTAREVTRREREEDQARRGSKHARPQASRVHIRTVRAPSVGSLRIPTLWRGILKGKKHFDQAPKEYRRRSVARVKYVANKQPGQWGAHGRYLAREGAQQEGGKGLGFDADGNGDLATALDDWQHASDERLWKVILSPEDGARMDLQAHTRMVLSEFEAHLTAQNGRPTPLEWVAIDHYNTENPHVHIAIRGVDGLGQPLTLSPPQIQMIRALSSEIATRELGYRSEHDIQLGRDRETTKARWTGLDREIETKIARFPDGRLAISIEGNSAEARAIWRRNPLTPKGPVTPEQQHIARLQHLETLGVAEKAGARTWIMDPGWKKALREMEVVRTRTQMLQEHRALLSDPRSIPVVTKLKPGDRLLGRVLGTGLDEQNDRIFLLLEGIDGRVHFVYQTRGMEAARAMGEMQPESIVVLKGEPLEIEGKLLTRVTVEDTGFALALKPGQSQSSISIPEKILADEARHAEGKKEQPPAPQEGLAGFAAVFRLQLAQYLDRERLRREKQKQIDEDKKRKPAEKDQKKGSEIG
jgi:hypothetical protein